MKKMIVVVMLIGSSAFATENIQGLHCGTRGNLLGTIASDFVIPDYFPPENLLLRAIFLNPFLIDLSVCEQNFSPVNFGMSCKDHDRCYASRGNQKEDCDSNLLKGWMQDCAERYGLSPDEDASYCSSYCEIAAKTMYNAMRYQVGDFCPSCRAFEKAQKRAQGFN